MRKLLSFLLITGSMFIFSFQYPYNRLSKLYNTDSEKCLIKAKKMMKIFSGNPAPYYFASCVHFDNAQTQETPRKKYNDMSKALSYARSMERIKDDEFESQIDWEEKSIEMNEFALDLIVELKDAKLKKLKDVLKSKLRRLKWEYKEKRKSEDKPIDVYVNNSIEPAPAPSVPEASMVSGQYYGLATGTEIIPSHDMRSEMKMLRIINEARKSKGMGTLEWNEDLSKAARYHAYDMGSQKYFTHNSQDRSGDKLVEVGRTFDRIKKFYTDSFVNSENIAAGNESAECTYNQWYNSPGHYDNLFNKSSKKVGIGVVHCANSPFGYYWVFCTAL